MSDRSSPLPRADTPVSECGPDCQEALDELERFLDGELPESEVGRVKQHLSDCYPCTERASFEEQLRAIVRRGCADAAPPDLVERIRSGLLTGDLPGVDPDGA
ncbi:mycothiol system anti-sigma-R factor [Nitriliruptor alkaliphilus]|uniref:mycothiol system anti-sigma-R factor n=1 Tax=Nitriliruptor alkaliphilus TaxID=427918 RepID=UPI000696D773|nr:mycothiol system anti-sigma-R factor [Nitriliruptor alkaliphilus]